MVTEAAHQHGFSRSQRAFPRTLLTAELAIVYGRFQRSYLSKLLEDQPCRACYSYTRSSKRIDASRSHGYSILRTLYTSS